MSRAGDRLRALAVRILDARSMERIVDPLLADLEMEYAEAIERGLVWKRRWILILGYSAFLKTIVLWQAEEIAASSRSRTMEDRAALGRALKFSAATGLIATLVLAAAPVRRAGVSVVHPGMFVFLIPQAIVLAVPIGFTLGVFLGLRGRTLSARSRSAVYACAIVCSCACLATFAWVVPSANQAFREAVFGRTVVKSFNELTVGELSERLRSFEGSGLAGWDSRVLAYTYHMRWALSCATLVLALFALALTRRMEARWAVALGATGACFSYYVLMWIGRAGALQESFPAFVGAWLPNAVFALLRLALTAVAPRKQDARA
jgi:lipopolysaccharide export system permease LptF/LptG-like protein